MKRFMLMITFLLSASCVQYKPIIPVGYLGELATIEDTFQKRSTGSAFFYCVTKVDGNIIQNAVSASLGASAGKGIHLAALGASRDIPVKPLKLFLIASVVHAAPIAALTDPDANNGVEGEVEFTPIPNMRYFVKGSIAKEYSSIWIEDSNRNIVSERIGKVDPAMTTKPPETVTQAKGSATPTRADLFLGIAPGESVASVREKLGNPDNIVEKITSAFASQAAHDYTTYEYKGLGSVQFYGTVSYTNTVEKTIRSASLCSDAAALKNKIDTTHSRELILLTKDYYLTDTPSVEYLDVLAEKVWTERDTSDRQMEDAMAYLILTIGKSNNSRYKTFLLTAATNFKSTKLKKYAKKSLALLPTDATDQFKPGIK